MIANLYKFKNLDRCCLALAEHIVALAQQCVSDKGIFTIAASGGTTPKTLYRLLAAPPFAEKMPWQQTHLFWGDERCVAPDHPDSNYRMVKEELLGQKLPANCTVYRMPGEKAPEDGAITYEETLKKFFSDGQNGVPKWPSFDLILLGLGSDGHTASLFPNTPALEENERWVVSTPPGLLDPQVDRITLTIPVINNAAEVAFLVAGEKKKSLIELILAKSRPISQYPASYIVPKGKFVWFIADA